MKILPILVLAVIGFHSKSSAESDRRGFWFRDHSDRLDVYLDQQRIGTYLKKHAKLTRRSLVNVMTPSGIAVTRNFPPRTPDDLDPGYQLQGGIIHPFVHSGIWLGFGDVDGNDFWRLQAKVAFDGFAQQPRGDAGTASFVARNQLMGDDGERVVCTEISRYRFQRVREGLILRIDAEYRSDERDFYFGDQEESGLAIRVASPLRVQGGQGAILNDRGERNGAGVWGKEARWFDYFGTIEGREVGVMVAASPKNHRASWIHARDYGLVVTNPFPKQPRERREPYVKTWVRRGEPFRLAYAILIHDLPADEPLDRKAAYATLLNAMKRDAARGPSRDETWEDTRRRMISVVGRFESITESRRAIRDMKAATTYSEFQEALAPLVLLSVSVNPESRIKIKSLRGRVSLHENRAQRFLVRVENAAGITAPLGLSAIDLAAAPPARAEWCRIEVVDSPLTSRTFTGAMYEFKVVQITPRVSGLREVRIAGDAGQGTQDLGFRATADVLLNIRAEGASKE